MDGLGLAARLLLGAILLSSAIPKLLAPLRFQQLVLQYGILPSRWAAPYSRCLPWVEIGMAASLISGVLVQVSAWTAAALMGSFVLALALSAASRKIKECGCLGRLYHISQAWLIVQDLALAGIALYIAYNPAPSLGLTGLVSDPADPAARLALLLGAVTVTAGITVGFSARWRPSEHSAKAALLNEEGPLP